MDISTMSYYYNSIIKRVPVGVDVWTWNTFRNIMRKKFVEDCINNVYTYTDNPEYEGTHIGLLLSHKNYEIDATHVVNKEHFNYILHVFVSLMYNPVMFNSQN